MYFLPDQWFSTRVTLPFNIRSPPRSLKLTGGHLAMALLASSEWRPGMLQESYNVQGSLPHLIIQHKTSTVLRLRNPIIEYKF